MAAIGDDGRNPIYGRYRFTDWATDAQLPLRGVVLCCTSIDPETRDQLSAWAAEMGADHKLDLTSDVTHLIVGETQTPKYKYVAREREDVKCLTENWIPAVRRIWMEGVDVPVKLLEEEHKLPTFFQLRICITGFDDPDQRKELETQITTHGGEYRGDLRKDCTHLICFSPAGAKYTSAKAWGNICTVSIEWLSMSIERGLVLDEQYFDPLLPPENRGKDAWKKSELKSPSLKRARVDELKANGVRKLRRTASSRFNTDSMWQDIVPAGPARKVDDGSGLRRTISEPVNKKMPPVVAPGDGTRNPSDAILHKPYVVSAVSKPVSKRGVFHGKTFLLHGFDQRRIRLLQQHLESQDGEVVTDAVSFSQLQPSPDTSSSFTIVPHSSSDEEISSTPCLDTNSLVTELWVEKCLHKKMFVEPDSEPSHKPFTHPVAGFEQMMISSTGFQGVDLMHMGKIVSLMGASYTDTFTKATSLLLCFDDCVTRQKFKHALRWNVPAVKVDWLWECVKSGQLKPWEDFLVHPNLQRLNTGSNDEQGTDSLLPSNAQPLEKRQLMGRKIGGNGQPDGIQSDSGDHESLRSTCHPAEPLNELSANLQQTGKALADGQPISKKGEDKSLVTSLHSLIARTREQSVPLQADTGQVVPRKKRQILGRARSDMSTRSNVSRADSINSMNTDGMGTPIDAGIRDSPQKPKATAPLPEDGTMPLSAELLLDHAEITNPSSEEDGVQAPAMTQIGYDNSEAVAWRDMLTDKMSGVKDRPSASRAENCEIGKRKPVLMDSGGTISKRTRLNTK